MVAAVDAVAAAAAATTTTAGAGAATPAGAGAAGGSGKAGLAPTKAGGRDKPAGPAGPAPTTLKAAVPAGAGAGAAGAASTGATGATAAAAPAKPIPMKAPPQPVLNLAARATFASQGDADKKALEEKAARKRKNAFFDALRRANKPTAVLLSPRVRRLLERALGLGGDDVNDGGDGGDGGDSGDGDVGAAIARACEGVGVLPTLASSVPAAAQAGALRASADTLLGQVRPYLGPI